MKNTVCGWLSVCLSVEKLYIILSICRLRNVEVKQKTQKNYDNTSSDFLVSDETTAVAVTVTGGHYQYNNTAISYIFGRSKANNTEQENIHHNNDRVVFFVVIYYDYYCCCCYFLLFNLAFSWMRWRRNLFECRPCTIFVCVPRVSMCVLIRIIQVKHSETHTRTHIFTVSLMALHMWHRKEEKKTIPEYGYSSTTPCIRE